MEDTTERKIAMVAPRPESPLPAGSPLRLKAMLEQLGNDRPYTIIRNHGNNWKIIFSGDKEPVIVKYEGSKPVIIKGDDQKGKKRK